jgi:hypothetical protein
VKDASYGKQADTPLEVRDAGQLMTPNARALLNEVVAALVVAGSLAVGCLPAMEPASQVVALEMICLDPHSWPIDAASPEKECSSRSLAVLSCLLANRLLLTPGLDEVRAGGSHENAASLYQDGHAEYFAAQVSPETDRAIGTGLTWLAGRQGPAGSFGSGMYRRNVAVSSLAGLTFMASGSSPGRGPFGASIERALRFVLDNTSPSGLICVPATDTQGPMYSHGFGTLFLAEAYGMTHQPEIRVKLGKAVRLIVDTQNAEGGWRYQPVRRDADLSVTICQINALRAARNAGVFVPKQTVDACIRYFKTSQNLDGGFRYMLPGGASAFPRSAAGVVAL